MFTIGITGGIGVGKTTVAHAFESFGVPVYNSDLAAKRLMNINKALKTSIKSLLGKQAYKADGTIDKHFVGATIFKDYKKRTALNALVHPVVAKDFKVWCKAKQTLGKAPYLGYESALIFENNIQDKFNLVLLVTAPLEARLARIMQRDNKEKAAVLAIIATQLPETKKMTLADFVINNQDLAKTLLKSKEIHYLITKLLS